LATLPEEDASQAQGDEEDALNASDDAAKPSEAAAVTADKRFGSGMLKAARQLVFDVLGMGSNTNSAAATESAVAPSDSALATASESSPAPDAMVIDVNAFRNPVSAVPASPDGTAPGTPPHRVLVKPPWEEYLSAPPVAGAAVVQPISVVPAPRVPSGDALDDGTAADAEVDTNEADQAYDSDSEEDEDAGGVGAAKAVTSKRHSQLQHPPREQRRSGDSELSAPDGTLADERRKHKHRRPPRRAGAAAAVHSRSESVASVSSLAAVPSGVPAIFASMTDPFASMGGSAAGTAQAQGGASSTADNVVGATSSGSVAVADDPFADAWTISAPAPAVIRNDAISGASSQGTNTRWV